MKIVRLKDNVVVEIIPEYATPVETWYGEEFAKQCVEAPDNVEQHWIYDGENFSEPKQVPVVEPDIVLHASDLANAIRSGVNDTL